MKGFGVRKGWKKKYRNACEFFFCSGSAGVLLDGFGFFVVSLFFFLSFSDLFMWLFVYCS